MMLSDYIDDVFHGVTGFLMYACACLLGAARNFGAIEEIHPLTGLAGIIVMGWGLWRITRDMWRRRNG